MSQAVDISQFALAVEDFLRPLASYAKGFRESAKKFDNLGDVIIVFAVFGAGLGIE